MFLQMSVNLLSEINSSSLSWVVCVCISRMWECYGSKDDGILKHLDLVIIDEQKTKKYVEIPPDVVPVLKNRLEEGKVILMKTVSGSTSKGSIQSSTWSIYDKIE